MKSYWIIRFALVLGCAGVLSMSAARAATEKVIYSFICSQTNCSDAVYPAAGLVVVKGTLYGTTTFGGSGGYGTVFSIGPSGTEAVLHSFGPANDGYEPSAGLIKVNGRLYGTTAVGGDDGHGTVFSITPGGKERVLYSFKGRPNDGSDPEASLIVANGALYGTTYFGGGGNCAVQSGPIGCGTVFSIYPTGSEKVLYEFEGGSDGLNPEASLIDAEGTLYGTTRSGGSGYGTVFSINPTTGAGALVYAFKGGSDGASPCAALIDVKGTLYGTTLTDGAYKYGTVFSMTTGGTEMILYSFKGGSDGGDPESSLINVNGTLYGTTTLGGGSGAGCDVFGCGTVYSITPSGKEKVIYAFKGGSDGDDPQAGLIDVKGTLYGTTYGGGNGYGTVFSIKP